MRCSWQQKAILLSNTTLPVSTIHVHVVGLRSGWFARCTYGQSTGMPSLVGLLAGWLVGRSVDG